ncbi:MAG: hypothetical protein HN337_04770 [Deltaproteobacteria bacterium]|jgi:hypothetical protein|nr:hypothetical protein [Deltaproteobacteria bacterium]
MSYKTDISYKVNKIRIDSSDKAKPKAQDLTASNSASPDTYITSSSNGYGDLVTGKNGTDARQHPRRFEAVQDILTGLTMPKTRLDHVVPHVPDLEQEIFKINPEQHDNMKPVVQRYIGLEKVILAHLAENKKMLDPVNMNQLSADEIEDLRAYRGELEDTLQYCNQQLQKSQLYYTWEKQRKMDSEV